jgi:hypothetical protein
VVEWRLLVSTLRVGVAENVDFGLEWRGGLVAELDGGGKAADWGDLQVNTKIHLLNELDDRPAFSMLYAVKLPSTRYVPDKLGSNATDFYFRLLASRTADPVEFHANAGFAILGSPSVAGYQDDIFLGTMAVLYRWDETTRSFLELYGFSGHQKSNRKTVVRGGVTMTSSAGYEWSLFGSLRATGGHYDFGTAFESSENWSLGFFLMRRFEL